jgi:hypothetical protein
MKKRTPERLPKNSQNRKHKLKELSSKTDLAEVVSLDGYQLKGVAPRFPADLLYLSSLM